jgi:diacylglycerol kinase (ATP)
VERRPLFVNRPFRCVAAIVSGASRLGADAVSASLKRHLGPSVGLRVHAVSSSDEATTAARAAAGNTDTVIAVGGDGTVADVATGIFRTGVALGIVPAGSTNITARSLGIPEDPENALALFGDRPLFRSIDVGRSGDRSFLHIAGAGFDAALFNFANPDWKRRVGWVAYVPAAAAALALPASEVRVITDETEIVARSSLVLVANGGSAIAPWFRIYPGILVDDGLLDVLVFTSSAPLEIAAVIWRAALQSLDRSPHVAWTRARTVRIEATPPLPVEMDGDPRGETPRAFHVAPGGLEVVVPRRDS